MTRRTSGLKQLVGGTSRPQGHRRPALPAAHHFTGENIEIQRGKVTSGLWSLIQKSPGSQTLGASIFFQLPHESPKSPGKAGISPHLAILGLGVMAIASVPVFHSSILLPRHRMAFLAPASVIATSSRLAGPPGALSTIPSLKSLPVHRGTRMGGLRKARSRRRRVEEAGSVWGAGEREHHVCKAAVLSGDAPSTPHPPPRQSTPYLPSPAPRNQTALKEARQVLNVSNVFHYKCSTIR